MRPYFPRMPVTNTPAEQQAQTHSVSPLAGAAGNGLPAHPDRFVDRHIGPNAGEARQMLDLLGYANLDALVDDAVPAGIRLNRPLNLPPARSEREALQALKQIAAQNRVLRSYLGMGYYDCITPAVLQRNMLENPGWYTPYTP